MSYPYQGILGTELPVTGFLTEQLHDVLKLQTLLFISELVCSSVG